MASVRVGTAGWAIPRALAERFPEREPELEPEPRARASALERYASVFDAVEINSSFWRHHRPGTYERWARTVPARFRFALKIPREVTHELGLVRTAKVLDGFFDEVSPLGPKLGPLLVQLPPSFALDRRVARAFFRLLRARHDGDLACEPRHPSWLTPDADALLAAFDVARVMADPARPPGAERPGGAPSIVYARLHGSPRTYYSPYGEERVAALAAQLRALSKAARVWCFFDNTASGAAAGDALTLRALLATGTAPARRGSKPPPVAASPVRGP